MVGLSGQGELSSSDFDRIWHVAGAGVEGCQRDAALIRHTLTMALLKALVKATTTTATTVSYRGLARLLDISGGSTFDAGWEGYDLMRTNS